jgi:hypothetical protein
LVVVTFAAPARADDPPEVRFNRDVRPILADHCYQCHGPDKARRKADLRLDTEDDARAVVVAGKPNESELVRRVEAHDAAERMPPKAGRPLSPQQVALLRKWVEQGARWEPHWAFIRPERTALPTTISPVTNPIDAFVVARLEREGLALSPPAGRTTLIRRMSLDLTGLPPTPEEVDAFLADDSPDAVGKLADRLLASPRYGERMAWRWLEAARYADTHGYQSDGPREMWRWRDWVIDAYNHNLPFDRFTVEQLAGDLLPSTTLDSRIATGFNRNHRGNSEGGIVPEEYAAEYVADRVETTATVWLGLTMTCCRCHDHKFDPLTQKEFYRLFAFFNNVPEKGRAVKFGNSPPFVKAPTPEQQRKLAELDAALAAAERRVRDVQPELESVQEGWEKAVDPAGVADWAPARDLLASWPLDDGAGLAARDGQPSFVAGRVGKAADLAGGAFLDADNVGDFAFEAPFSFAFWVNPRKNDGAILSRMKDEPQGTGYGVALVGGRLRFHLTVRWLDDAMRVETERAIEPNRWHHVAVAYDGSRLAAGLRVYLDGDPAPTKTLLDELNQPFNVKEPFRIGSGGGKESRFDGLIDDLRVYGRVLEPDEARILSVAATPAEILRTAADRRTAAERDKLRAFFLATAAPKDVREAHAARVAARDARQAFWDAVPTVMVMEETATPRDTFVLVRGEYDKRGEKVTAGTPAVFPPMPAGMPANRFGLARWLVDPAHPLTARVAVNRAWQLHFGTGLVRTAEDFGTQGEFPSHPELLDWLAVEFRKDWDLKRLHKLIVTSATYRQSSRVTKELLARDPGNRLLARFPRYRLSAEMVRDQALFVSGLLVERQGGPSVKPYQPAGLWKELTGTGDYVADTGQGLYRRSLYTFWKRTVAPPALAVFDAAGRETCWVRETRTNTPLQALTLLNETGLVEAARALAQRTIREATTPDDRLTRAFRRVTGRPPTDAELKVLRDGLEDHLAGYRRDPAAAKKLLAVGASKPDPALDPSKLAAYATVCGLLLNLDEVVTKE